MPGFRPSTPGRYQDAGMDRFAAPMARRWIIAFFEHLADPWTQLPHLHNMVSSYRSAACPEASSGRRARGAQHLGALGVYLVRALPEVFRPVGVDVAVDVDVGVKGA